MNWLGEKRELVQKHTFYRRNKKTVFPKFSTGVKDTFFC
jgi:hypothetical protein